MKEFIDYLNRELPDEKGNKILFKFKRHTLDTMNDRYKEVSARGLDNRKVFTDLIISEHPDLEKEYTEFHKKETEHNRRKKSLKANLIGSVIYILALVAAYLGISFTTKMWDSTWVVIVDGILLWVAYLLTVGVVEISTFRRIYHIFARICLALCVMVLSVATFLTTMILFDLSAAWVAVLLGVATLFIADLIYISLKKQKLRIINWLIYIPVICATLFVVLSFTGVFAWSTGWLLIIAGLVVDILIALGVLIENKKFEKEMNASWKEN